MKIARSIAVVGTGYVGMACAISLSEQGFRVTGHDVNRERILALQQGVTPYKEDGLEEALAVELQSGRLSFTTSLLTAVHAADVVIICVNTPTTANGEADLSDLETVISDLQSCDLAESVFVAVRSTVPPGTCDRLARALHGRAHVVMTPEFLREGRALADTRNPSRNVIGAESAALAGQYALLLNLDDAPIVLTTRINAELTKLASNSFLAVKITFANEVANLTEAFGGDVREVLHGIGMDQRIGSAFLQPGIGFGGPCLTKDLKSYEAVAAQKGVATQLVSATLAANRTQPLLIVDKLERELQSLAGATIGVWGLTFKAGTDDVRYSLAQGIIAELTARGAQVLVYDPKARATELPFNAVRVAHALDAANTDALLLLTEWPQFAALPVAEVAALIKRKLIVDGRNLLDGERYAAAGVRYFGVGVTHMPSNRPVPRLPVIAFSSERADMKLDAQRALDRVSYDLTHR